MAQGIRAACPTCGHVQHFPNLSISSMTAVGNGMNFAVTCPACGALYDATDGGDGEFVPDEVGRLRLVRGVREAAREVLADKPTVDELLRLVESLQHPSGGVADAVARVQAFPRLEDWVRRNPALAATVGGLLAILLTALVGRVIPPSEDPPPRVDVKIEQPSDSELQRLIDRAVEDRFGP